MKDKLKLIFALILSVVLSNHLHARKVMSWIPVYGIAKTKTYLNDPIKKDWFKNGLTHIGLQFWVPGDNGAVVFVTDYQFTSKAATISQDVQDYVTWGNANNVKIMLCFHNIREYDFDWTYTKTVIDDYPYESVANIMTIINMYNLDGVDIDFEGLGSYAADKPNFVAFLDTLGKALHASGKELSVDMFSTPCYNFPNPSWGSDMAAHVDFMTNMGYSDLYESNTTQFNWCPATPSEAGAYAFQFSYIEDYITNTQGVPSSKHHYGIPSWETEWGGKTFHQHLLDIIDISSAGGISIWDLQLSGNGLWLEEETWKIIEMFKNDSTSAQIQAHATLTLETHPQSTITPTILYNSYTQLVTLSRQNGTLYLYSSLGKLEKSWTITEEKTILLPAFTSGLYILKYETEFGVETKKILITY